MTNLLMTATVEELKTIKSDKVALLNEYREALVKTEFTDLRISELEKQIEVVNYYMKIRGVK